MPSANNEYRAAALYAMLELRAELRRALNGPAPRLEDSRLIAAEIRHLREDAIKILGQANVCEFDDHVDAARAETLRSFGTSGWDAAEARPPDLQPLKWSKPRR